MVERDFQTEFGKKNKEVGVFELKFCKGKSLPFSVLPEHQEEALFAASSGKGLYHKITDQPVFKGSKVRFTRKKPFDCFRLENIPAYVVIMFWVPRTKKNVYYIPIDSWVEMWDKSVRKSVTEDMALTYCSEFVSYLKKKVKQYPKNKPIRLSPYKLRKLQREVLERDGFTCQICGAFTQAPPHHIVYRSHLGDDTMENLITLCISCHRKVHDGKIKLDL